MVLGLSPRLEGEEGEAAESDLIGDRIDITLPGSQEELLHKIYEVGKPIVLILTGGSALSFTFAKENIPAILYVWYPGEEGGKAVADVIFGNYNPAGRLPVTFYKSIEQIPDVRDYNMEGRTYRYFNGEPLYPFGFGLSYSKFQYDSLKISPNKIKAGEKVKVTVKVKNIGNRAGDEVVQLYLKHPSTSFRIPIHELKGFKRISLNPNETKTVCFTLDQNSYRIINMEGEKTIHPGKTSIFVGGGQPNTPFSQDIKEGELIIEK